MASTHDSVVRANEPFAAAPLGEPMQTRTCVADPRGLPWRKICLLDIVWPNGEQRRGTGFLAGSRLVVTAGHCIFDRAFGGWADRIGVVPACAADDHPFDSYSASTLHTVEGWTERGDDGCDYGAVALAVPIGDRLGWFEPAVFSDDQLRDQQVYVAGYPVGLVPDRLMWRSTDVVREATAARVQYRAMTGNGDSGAPVFVSASPNGTDDQVVAIHTDGLGPDASGTRITAEVRKNILLWREPAGR